MRYFLRIRIKLTSPILSEKCTLLIFRKYRNDISSARLKMHIIAYLFTVDFMPVIRISYFLLTLYLILILFLF